MLRRRCARIALAVLAASMNVAGCSGPGSANGEAGAQPAGHVGRRVCAGCHRVETALWEGSHHDQAMQPADEDTVVGDFDGTEFVYAGVTTRFFRRDGKFMVRTDGPAGTLEDYEVAYTFGVDPLQQYLIAFPGGRYQALGVTWDARPAGDGGQRWFHLYPDEAVDHDDILHWTASLQNWNYMCAECHSTNLRKNYDVTDDSYDTTWSEIDVSCEACHGPGSRHVDWAREAERGDAPSLAGKGLEVRLADDDAPTWMLDPGASTARRDPPGAARTQIEACARCHARRTQLTDDYRHGRPLADTHLVALLDEALYHADGQVLDEVYVYGSFRQSAMYRAGVTCTDCHDPHSARLRLEGNATCSPCHRQDAFDTPEHHFHKQGSTGASCVGCHMPERSFMVVDPRHDHSFRVPRPDLTLEIGTPNACTDCHAERGERGAQWAADTVAGWYSGDRTERPHYAEAIQAGRTWRRDAGPRLTAVIEDRAVPGIVRATALTLLRNYLTPSAIGTVQASLSDEDPLVRRAAVGMLASFEADARMGLGAPALADPVRTVRLEAARVLAAVPHYQLDDTQRAARERGLQEYAEVQRFNEDRPEARLNLGWFHLQQGRPDEAERAYLSALRATPPFAAAAVNLADLYRTQGREAEGEALLREALAGAPDDPRLHDALGLSLVRQKRHAAAIEHFEHAYQLAPERPHYAYVLAVALHSTGNTPRALELLKRAHERYPGHADILFLLAAVSRDAGNADAAARYARSLLGLVPGHPGAAGLLGELEAKPPDR